VLWFSYSDVGGERSAVTGRELSRRQLGRFYASSVGVVGREGKRTERADPAQQGPAEAVARR